MLAGGTVLLGVIVHGVTANPLVKAIAGQAKAQPTAAGCAKTGT